MAPSLPQHPFRNQSFDTQIEIQRVEIAIKKFETTDRAYLEHLEMVEKVIMVASLALPVGIVLSIHYYSFWFAVGIGLPTGLILASLEGKVKGKIEKKKLLFDANLLYRDMLKRHTIQVLHPFGEHDTRAYDPRMKSDKGGLRELLQKRNPKSAIDIEKLVGARSNSSRLHALDLEVTDRVKSLAISKLSGGRDAASDWRQIQAEVIEAKKHLRRDETESYQKIMVDARKGALGIHGKPPLLGNMTPQSDQSMIKQVINKHSLFNQHDDELNAVYNTCQDLFPDEFGEEWGLYQQLKSGLEQAIGECDSENEVLRVYKIALHLDFIINYTGQLKQKIESRIATHSTRRIEEYKRQCAVKDKMIFGAETLQQLRAWMERNPELAESPMGNVTRSWPQGGKIRRWIELNPEFAELQACEVPGVSPQAIEALQQLRQWIDWNPELAQRPISEMPNIVLQAEKLKKWAEKQVQWVVDPVSEIYEYQLAMRTAFENVKEGVDALTPGDDIDAFEKEVWRPFKAVMGGATRNVSWGKWLWSFKPRKPRAHPFEAIHIPQEMSFRKSRKIEELILNDILQKVDRNMLNSYTLFRVIEYGAGVSTLVFMGIFGVGSWVFYAALLSAPLVKFGSYLFENRLRKLDHKKQEAKLQMLLRDRPLMTHIPGSRPELLELKSVQRKYGLDGVTRTWVRALIEGDQAVFADTRKEIAQKGSEEARPAVESLYLDLRTRQSAGDRQYDDEIKELKHSLHPEPGDRNKLQRTYADDLGKEWGSATRKREGLEAKLDGLKQDRVHLREQMRRYERNQKQAASIKIELTGIDREQLLREYQDAERECQRLLQLSEQFPVAAEGLREQAQNFQLKFLELNQRIQEVDRMESRLELANKYAPCVEAIEQLNGFIEEGKQELAEAKLKERQKEILLRWEKGLIALDPKWEERQNLMQERGYLLQAIKNEGSETERTHLKRELLDLEKKLCNTRLKIEEVRQDLIEDISEHPDETVREKLRKCLNMLHQGKEEIALALLENRGDINTLYDTWQVYLTRAFKNEEIPDIQQKTLLILFELEQKLKPTLPSQGPIGKGKAPQ